MRKAAGVLFGPKNKIKKTQKKQETAVAAAAAAGLSLLRSAVEPEQDDQCTVIRRVHGQGRRGGQLRVSSHRRGHPGWNGSCGRCGCLAGAGMYCHEDDMVHGMDGSDSRNERMILKVVGKLVGDSDHKYNPVALSQLAEAWPSSRTVSIELDEIGAYSFNEGG